MILRLFQNIAGAVPTIFHPKPLFKRLFSLAGCPSWHCLKLYARVSPTQQTRHSQKRYGKTASKCVDPVIADLYSCNIEINEFRYSRQPIDLVEPNIEPQILICAPLLRATLGNSYSRMFPWIERWSNLISWIRGVDLCTGIAYNRDTLVMDIPDRTGHCDG